MHCSNFITAWRTRIPCTYGKAALSYCGVIKKKAVKAPRPEETTTTATKNDEKLKVKKGDEPEEISKFCTAAKTFQIRTL